ncbi:hypothetical protein [Phenylobacterium sp.]|uniref:hypothetical protein n=1 Tax=Phenylobacterium sp. TaxID=1871053 RepID=UPI003BAA6052
MAAKILTSLAAAALLAGCATPPQAVRAGDPAFADGKTLALAPSAATPGDRARLDQAGALALDRLKARDARLGDPASADYLLQVTFAALPKGVGVMRDKAGDWLADPKAGRRWGLRGPAYALNVTAIDTRTGKAAFSATATERAHGEPAAAVDRLVTAALARP